jgi:hypothetical protein
MSKVTPGSSVVAPFIYTDGPATYGVRGGIVEIELAAGVTVPNGTSIARETMIVAHLRCTTETAA